MNRQWVLAERPVAAITARTFAMCEAPVPEPGGRGGARPRRLARDRSDPTDVAE